MTTRIPSHQLSSGLYVSGRPEQLKERQPTMASRAVPYTGGDVKKSGELGKMFDIQVTDQANTKLPSRPSSSSQPNSGSVRSGSNSGPVKKTSGPLPLQPTGLITSGPIGSGPLSNRRSGQLDYSGSGSGSVKAGYGSAVTSLGEDVKVGFRVSRAVAWVVMVVVAMGVMVGAFLMVAVKKAVVLVAVAAVVGPLFIGMIWNCVWGRRGLLGFVKKYPDTELRGAIDGQYVKVTGNHISKFMSGWVLIEGFRSGDWWCCGSIDIDINFWCIPLESSYQRVPRCVYVSTELHEYKGCGGKPANPKHRCFSWGSRHLEKYVSDFYISDFRSGLRALVKAGYGAKVAPFVKPATVVNITKGNRDLSPSFLRWLADRNLSSDDRIMRLKEGYIKEGSTVSVMGVVRRHDNVLMIVPSTEPVSTGCQWSRCLLPTYVEGLILTCEDNQDGDVVPV
ncbi:ubiquitin-specific protease family C19-related protein [Citrus sinensis]|nr:ubiquitin-specific protease family C19-related protein [Citrus sinensis]